MNVCAVIVPDDACLFDVAQSAAGRHLHVITNGRRCALSPTVPQGWTRVDVRNAQAAPAARANIKELQA